MIGEYLLPPSNKLPRTYRDLKNIMNYVGMDYQAIDACPNDHILYYNQYEFATECPICHSSRYRTDQVTKKVSRKVLRYIPVKYNIVEEVEDGVEEEGDHVEDQHESDVDDHNVTQEDVEELVEADDVSDNVHHDEDDYIDDDDDDIAFNPYNVESGSDDTDVDLDTDEDDDEVH